MKNVIRTSMLAGLALAATAGAQSADTMTKMAVRRAPAAAIRATVIDASARSNQLVYAVTDVDGLVGTNGALPKQLLDDVSVIPGPGSNGTFPLTINAMNLSFAVTAPLADFDIEVTFWDSADALAAANNPIHIQPIDGFVVGIDSTQLGGAGAFTTGLIDLSALPNGGIVLPDAGCMVLMRYVEPNTTTITSAAVQIVFDDTIDPVTLASTVVGSTDAGFWRDVDNDDILEVAEARNFAYPDRGGMLIELQADVPAAGNPCPADFNGDQFLDFFDYDGFVQAFETGC